MKRDLSNQCCHNGDFLTNLRFSTKWRIVNKSEYRGQKEWKTNTGVNGAAIMAFLTNQILHCGKDCPTRKRKVWVGSENRWESERKNILEISVAIMALF